MMMSFVAFALVVSSGFCGFKFAVEAPCTSLGRQRLLQRDVGDTRTVLGDEG